MKLKLSTKLIALFAFIGLAPFLAIGMNAYITGGTTLRDNAFNTLSFIRENKKAEIESYFVTMRSQVITLSEDTMLVEAMTAFSQGFALIEESMSDEYERNRVLFEDQLKARYVQQKANTPDVGEEIVASWWPKNRTTRMLQHLYISSNPFPIGEKEKLDAAQDQSHYSTVHTRYHPILRSFMERFGYYDLFLVDAKTGFVVYSAEKEIDFATNLVNGPHSNSGLARVFTEALKAKDKKDAFVFADFEPYAPSKNDTASFAASPIFNGDEMTGVLVFQLPVAKIDQIMTNDGRWEKVGLGKSGESILVGRDFKLRSNPRDLIEDHEGFVKSLKELGVPGETVQSINTHDSAIGFLTFKNNDVEEGLEGKSHFEVTRDYLNRPVLLAHGPVEVAPGVQWAVISLMAEDEAFASLIELRRAMWVFGIVGGLAVITLGWYFARSISVPLNKVVNILATSTTQISAAINEQERIINQQASSVNETNTTMEELGSSSRQSAEQAEAAASGAQKVMELADEGTERVQETLNGMTSLKEKVEDIAQQILRLSEQINRVGEITNTVTDFANETKMLAMNAAVEAVRAGEHGKGFSVLSVEIRKLADESKRSAERISKLVSEIQKSTNATVMVTEEGTKTVEIGMRLTQDTAETFDAVAGSIGSASENTQQISLNIRQQAIAVKQVVEAMNSLNAGAKETASGIGQIKEGIKTLNVAAQDLKNMM